MPEQWTGDIVGKMHNYRISYDDLSEKLGYAKGYISMVLNGHRKPKGAEQKFRQALDELIQQKQKLKMNGGT